jgi:hypothetical protein
MNALQDTTSFTASKIGANIDPSGDFDPSRGRQRLAFKSKKPFS